MYLTRAVNVSPTVPDSPTSEDTATDVLEAGTLISSLKDHYDEEGRKWTLIQYPPRSEVREGTEVVFAWVLRDWLDIGFEQANVTYKP